MNNMGRFAVEVGMGKDPEQAAQAADIEEARVCLVMLERYSPLDAGDMRHVRDCLAALERIKARHCRGVGR